MNLSKLDAKFDELIRYMSSKTIFATMGDDPVYYFVYPPKDALLVKRKREVLKAKLQHKGWDPLFFSLGKKLQEFIEEDEYFDDFLDYEREHPFDFSTINESIRDRIERGDHSVLDEWVSEKLEEAAGREQGVLVLTDIELLHPYARIGRIEAHLQGKVRTPLVVLYPGSCTSRYGLKFLDFYPPDGNYRSIHICPDT